MKTLGFVARIRNYFEASPPDIEQRMLKAAEQVQTPTVCLLGKVQSGKSSIVATLTGRDDIGIGEGFRACTKERKRFAYPSEETPLIYFLDGRGILEVGYDHHQDFSANPQNAHILLLVVKANDHNLQELLVTAQRLKKKHPEWPCLLVQTCLHETYPAGVLHEDPYPEPDGIPLDPQRSVLTDHLLKQRELCASFSKSAVAIDFTLSDDGYVPNDYGRAALLRQLEEMLPVANWNLIQALDRWGIRKAYLAKAQPQLLFYSGLAASVSHTPIPLIDLPLLALIHGKMLRDLNKIYHNRLNSERLGELWHLLGISAVSPLAWRALLKFVPGGSLLYAAYTGAFTYALGMACCSYLELVQEGTRPDAETLKKVFNEQLASSKNLFSKSRG